MTTSSLRRGTGRPARSISAPPTKELRYDCFLGDVVLLVGGVDMSARWGWVPVLDFGLCLLSIAEALASGAEQSFEYTESDAALVFRCKENAIEVSANYVDGIAEVALVEFSREVERFVRRLGDELGRAHTELGDNAFFAMLLRTLSQPT